ncbi:MAG: ammonium transporter [Vampirovibrionales bacterium]|nr:ammonium transporter [Vampirovibrionales bacterium]
MNPGDIAWILLSSSLVMLMTPAVGFFYGGMVRRKNLLSTLMLSFTTLIVVTLQWVYFGYSLAFGPDVAHLIGNLSWMGLLGVDAWPNADYAGAIPHMAFMLFQMKFAIITPALISGAIVERVRFTSFLLFILLWTTLVYDPIAHWVWGMGGWLRNLGALDFAGGTVIHITSGVAALALSLVVRKRKTYGKIEFEPYSIPLTLLGAILLWFGWFGFNGGSALAANGLAVHAIVTSNVAAASAGLTWLILGLLRRGRPSVIGVATGAVVGLVAITPACGFVDVNAAFWIGVVGAVVSYLSMRLTKRMQLDDTLDVWACHGMAGTWGALATGLFASKAVNPAGAYGLLFGNTQLFIAQLISVAIAWGFSFVMTLLIAWLVNKIRPLTVEDSAEDIGLDIAQHGEEAYAAL